MPDISSMSYGFSVSGVEKYLEEIKTGALKEATEAVRDISSITSVCDNGWEGKAKGDFIRRLRKDSEHVADQLERLYKVLVSEVYGILNAMAEKDKNLFKD